MVRRMKPDAFRWRGRLARAAALLIFFAARGGASAADDAVSIWGRVKGEAGIPVRNLCLVLSAPDGRRSYLITTDDRGGFQLIGLPVGRYRLRVESRPAGTTPAERTLLLARPAVYVIEIGLPGGTSDGVMTMKLISPDDLYSPLQTFIGRDQLERLPSGNDVWTVIENQDFSATMNRIDVGGMWATRPGLFSARGGGSWTQTSYRLNGVDITDPYQPGLPLFWPDPFALESLSLTNAAPAPWISSPGGVLDLATPAGGDAFHGGLSFFGTGRRLHSINITPGLQAEGLRASHTLDSGLEGNARLSGPLIKDKLDLFLSWTSFTLVRDLADTETPDRSYLASGLVQLAYRTPGGRLRLLWTGQSDQEPTYGAGRNIPFSSTLNRDQAFDVVQAVWDGRIGERQTLSLGAVYNRGRIDDALQDGASGCPTLEILENIPGGPAVMASRSVRTSWTLFGRGSTRLPARTGYFSRLDYGLELRGVGDDTSEDASGGRQLRFFQGRPLEVAEFDRPSFRHREGGLILTAALQERLILANFLSITAGLNLSSCSGHQRGSAASGTSAPNRIRWINLSPRLSLTVPLWGDRTADLRLDAGRYYYGMALNLLTYGQAGAPGALIYAWDDRNGDLAYEDGEKGRLLRREGPAYGAIDPGLKRPFTDAYSMTYHQELGRGWRLGLAGFYRETRRLIEAVNTGVPFSAYDPVELNEAGDDMIPGTYDDLTFTVFNQRPETLGQDFLVLTNPTRPIEPVTRYRGIDLTLVKPIGARGGFYLAVTASEAIGTTSPGNSEWENDDGIPGSLFADPNNLINAKGRVRFDRAYVVRTGLALDGPFGTRLAVVGKYYDGQPFARWIVVEGFNQGPFAIMAHPRGVARYEFNMTWDTRVEKVFAWSAARLRLILDGFNVFNQHLATAENPWTGPDWPLRFATEIQSPRIFRLGLAYEF
jgi:hypothetical protein